MSLSKVKMKKIWIFVIAGIVAAVVGGRYIINSFSVVETDDAYIEGRIHVIALKSLGRLRRSRLKITSGLKREISLLRLTLWTMN